MIFEIFSKLVVIRYGKQGVETERARSAQVADIGAIHVAGRQRAQASTEREPRADVRSQFVPIRSAGSLGVLLQGCTVLGGCHGSQRQSTMVQRLQCRLRAHPRVSFRRDGPRERHRNRVRLGVGRAKPGHRLDPERPAASRLDARQNR